MSNTSSKNAVGWFEIYVEDMKRAKTFYEKVFELSLDKLAGPGGEDMWSFGGDYKSYGAQGALVKMPGFESGKNSVLIYFSCDDCSVEEKRIVPAGGKVEKSKFSIGEYGFISLVLDTERNMFGLHSTL